MAVQDKDSKVIEQKRICLVANNTEHEDDARVERCRTLPPRWRAAADRVWTRHERGFRYLADH